ncbi:MAG: bifunctional folylpolyglutamate synthase/dihydrofolate synthase [Chloroflexota bacterium]
MNYEESLAYILGFSDYERRRDPAWSPTRFSLERVEQFCATLGRPQDAFPSIHIAGTKGKGSTAAMLHGALMAAHLRAGLYTSPHLHDFRERIRIDRHLIPADDLARLTTMLAPLVSAFEAARPEMDKLTTFEVITALAFLYFQEQAVDVAVLEAGLGGRLDATNVVHPLVSIITSISMDHTNVLGDSLGAIAREKAGIVKEGGLVVSPPQPPEALAVLEEVCRERGAALRLGGRDWRWQAEPGEGRALRLTVEGPFPTYRHLAPALLGRHQLLNAATAVVAMEALREGGLALPREAVAAGLAQVRWPGRLEILRERPTVVVDGAHNDESARRLREALGELFPHRQLWLILGMSSDKDVAGIVRELAPAAAHVIATRSHHPRSAPAEALAEQCRPYAEVVETAPDVASALATATAQAGPEDLICVTGSLFAMAEAREAYGLTSVE